MRDFILKKYEQTDKGTLFLIMVFIFTVFFLLTPWIYSDGVGEYAWVRSLFMDGDLDCSNEFDYYVQEFQERFGWEGAGYDLAPLKTATGHQANKYPIGTALLWSPFFLIGHAVTLAAHVLGMGIKVDGYSRFYVFFVSFGTCFYGFLALLLSYKISRFYFKNWLALFSTITIWFASSIPVYMYLYPSLPHITSLFMVSLFIYYWWRTRENRITKEWAILGLIGGVMALVRLENISFFILPFLQVVYQGYQAVKNGNRQELKKYSNQFLLFLGCYLLVFSLQIITWKVVFGKYFVNPYTATEVLKLNSDSFVSSYEDPYTKADSSTGIMSILIYLSHPDFFKVYFGSAHGLFSWTPVLLLAILGLIFLYRRDKSVALFLILTFFAISYVVSCIGGAGASFGNRYLLKCGLIYIIGLTAFLHLLSRKFKSSIIAVVCFLFIGWNLLFIVQYSTGLVNKQGPISWSTMIRNQVTKTPEKLISELKPFITGRSSAYEKNKTQK